MYRFHVEYRDGREMEILGMSERECRAMHRALERSLGMNPLIRAFGWALV